MEKVIKKLFNRIYACLNSFLSIKPAIFWLKYIHSSFRKGKNLTFYSKFLKKGDLCFDIGANIGIKTDLFLGLGCRVVAVEPQKECFDYMKNKFRNKGLVLVNKALDYEEGEKPIFISNLDAISSLSPEWISTMKKRYPSVGWDQKRIVKTTTLDRLIKEHGKPKFCKIDVEGYELNVLQGLSSKIGILAFEFNHEAIAIAEKCVNRLASLGKVVFNYTEKETAEYKLVVWVNAKDMIRIIRKSSEDNVWGDIYSRTV